MEELLQSPAAGQPAFLASSSTFDVQKKINPTNKQMNKTCPGAAAQNMEAVAMVLKPTPR